MIKHFTIVLVVTLLGLCHPSAAKERGLLGTYSGVPRLANEHVDLKRLLSELKDIKANTYNWLIWMKPTDWEDLQAFLPMARKAGIKVWVTLVPHSESPPKAKFYSEPFRLDFERWATELAKLSKAHPNLTAWSIDDFVHNLDSLTPAYVQKFTQAAKGINPKFNFIPCCYYRQITPVFAKNYHAFLDGILFPYRAESVKPDLINAGQVKAEIDTVKRLFSPSFPVVLDIYATAHSRLGASTPEYVEEVLRAGMESADGVFIYCHQDPVKQPQKYKVIKEGFSNKQKKRMN